MLAPLRPDRNDPRYRERQEQYRRDVEAARRHPADWGRIDPRGAVSRGRKRRRHGRMRRHPDTREP